MLLCICCPCLQEILRILEEMQHPDIVHSPQEALANNDVLSEFFKEMPLFSSMPPLQLRTACNLLDLQKFTGGMQVVKKGKKGTRCYVILKGQIVGLECGSGDREFDEETGTDYDPGEAVCYGPGQEFGEQMVKRKDMEMSGDNEADGEEDDGRWPCTLVAEDYTLVVSLRRADYIKVTGDLIGHAIRCLEKPPDRRRDNDLQVLHSLFEEGQYFKSLYYESLQFEACRRMYLSATRDTLPMVDHTGEGLYHIVIKGEVEIFGGEDAPPVTAPPGCIYSYYVLQFIIASCSDASVLGGGSWQDRRVVVFRRGTRVHLRAARMTGATSTTGTRSKLAATRWMSQWDGCCGCRRAACG